MLLLLALSAAELRFYVDPVVYRQRIELEDTAEHTSTVQDVYYIEFNCEIPYQELKYHSAEDIIFANAVIPFALVDLDHGDSLIDTLYRQFTIPSFSYAAKEQLSFLIQFGTYAADGSFRYRVELLSGDRSGRREDELEIRREAYALSDINLASEITIDSTGDQLRKGNLRVIPRPSRVFDNRFRHLFFYYEIYDITPGQDTLTAVYTVTDGQGDTLRKVTRKIEQTFASQAVNCGIDIQNMPAGAYELTVAIEDDQANRIAAKATSFELAATEMHEVSFEGLPYYDEIEYFLDPRDYRKFSALPEDGKKAYLERFWRAHDYNEIAERFTYADEHYKHGDTPGRRTDRGRIYVKYGVPDEIDRPLPLEHQESRSYEHWQYVGGQQFVFVDIRGVNDYELVWTNAIGERSQPTLYKYLPPGIVDTGR